MSWKFYRVGSNKGVPPCPRCKKSSAVTVVWESSVVEGKRVRRRVATCSRAGCCISAVLKEATND